MIQRLDWDSDFFGYEVGKLEIVDIINFNFDVFKNEAKKFKLVCVFSNLELNVLILLHNVPLPRCEL